MILGYFWCYAVALPPLTNLWVLRLKVSNRYQYLLIITMSFYKIVLSPTLFKVTFILLCTSCLSVPKVLKYSDGHNLDKKLYVPRVVNGWPAKLGDVPYQVFTYVMFHLVFPSINRSRYLLSKLN